ncbi:MAG: glycosyl hydrolase 2 galactose-binding domain-containing protein, partial [Acidobacteriaceae bacterium]
MLKLTAAFSAALLALSITAAAQLTVPENLPTNTPPVYGPFNAVFLTGGDGLQKSLTQNDTVLQASSPWTLFAWIKPAQAPTASEFIAGFGDPEAEYSRYLALAPGKLILWGGEWSTHSNTLEAAVTLAPGQWHFIAATFDGRTFHLYSDGTEVASGPLVLGSVTNELHIAPPTHFPGWSHFGGKIAGLTLAREALSTAALAAINKNGYNFSDVVYEQGSKPWEVQTRGQAGYRAPQRPDEMPRSKAPFQSPEAQPVPHSARPVELTSPDHWTLSGNWTLAEAPKVSADGPAIASPSFRAKNWYAAVVPGTVLTTLVARGVYPNPYYGLNNLAIPESLNKQDYWYRNEFRAPEALQGKHITLTFEGINYKADIWLNGQSIGSIKGAFIRGIFDVTHIIHPGKTNVLAVRISPPPHPGIPQEQSIKGGPGQNGGLMCLDGPTFVATEGWDWIPAIRDRDSGIWQPVTLTATNAVQIGDPQVITTLPLPSTTSANVEINVPLTNTSAQPTHATLNARFEGVSVTKHITLAPGQTAVSFAPADFPQLTVHNPRLWWPNGYGKPNLYHLKLS